MAAAILWPAASARAQGVGSISEVVVEGAQRVEPGTVRSYLLIKAGDPFDPIRINKSLKSLFATGLFADVTIRRDGQRLVVNVVENPIINRIAFEGNRKIEDKTLEAEVTLRARVIFTRTKVQNDLQRILAVYRRSGRFGATVEPKVIRLPQNRIDLVFEINEGEPTSVSRISFVGNKVFDDGDLRSEIQTKESAWYRILSSDDTYDPDRLTLDRELLRQHYLSEGYADFRVESAVAELTPDRKNFFITFSVQEGERFKFGKVNLATSIKKLDVDAVKESFDIESGDWYDAKAVEKAIQNISGRVGELGFAFVEVRPRLNRHRDDRTIDLVMEVNEGPRVFVERIDIVGNVRTQDKVVRREFRLVEGDAFNTAKLRRSRQRIQNLDFFETVQLEQLPGSAPDKTVVKLAVQEKSTGSISLGAGFSTENGPLGDFGLRERNFLGRGQDIGLKLTLAARRSEIDFSFTEPYFLDRDIRAGVDIFHVTESFQDFSSFDSKRTGGAVRAGYSISEFLRQSWRYEFKVSTIEDVSSSASTLIQAEEGTDIISQVSHTLRYDKRDSVIQPTEGYVVILKDDLAGLGGVKFFRNQLTAAKFWNFLDKDLILRVSGKAGYIFGLGEDVPLNERFFVGGSDIRGFSTSGVGPRDTGTDDALGGEWMYTASAELTFPLGLPAEFGFQGRAFTDMGSTGQLSPSGSFVADTGSLRASVGLGVTWSSPFGPLGLDFGVPVLKEGFDETEFVRVNFGTRF